MALRLLSAAAMTLWLVAVIVATQPLGKAFPGFLVEANLDVSTMLPSDWNGARHGLAAYDVLLTANGRPLRVGDDLDAIVAQAPAGQPITYEFLRQGLKKRTTIPTQTFTWRCFWASVGQLLAGSAAFMALGILVFWLRPRNPAGHAHLLMTLAVGLTYVGCVVFFLTHRYTQPFLIWTWMLGASFFHLALVFPTNMVKTRPALALLAYVPVVLVAFPFILYYRPVGYSQDPAIVAFYLGQLKVYALWMALGLLAFVANVVGSIGKGATPKIRNQAWLVLVGTIAGFAPLLLAYIVPVLQSNLSQIKGVQVAAEVLGSHLFPLTIGYAIVRHQLFDIQLVLRRATLYAALMALLAGVYATVSLAAFDLLEHLTPHQTGPSLAGFVAALAVAVTFGPAHQWLRGRVDRLFLGDRLDALELVAHFDPGRSADRQELARSLVVPIARAMAAAWVEIHLEGHLVARHGEPRPVSGEAALSFPLGEAGGLSRVDIGPKLNELPYPAEERTLLAAIATQARLSLHNLALAEERLALRVQETVSRELAEERRRLLMQVVHDLRTDLMIIVTAAQLAKIEPDDSEPLESIIRSVHRIEDFLGEKSTWANQSRPSGRCELTQVLETVSQMMGGQLRAKRQVLAIALAPGDCVVPLTSVQLEQILLNLMTNASKFAPEGAEIRVESVSSEGQVTVGVLDPGPGIAPELIDQLGTGAHSSGKGHGFGLQNVKAIVEGVGGTLSWHNTDLGAAVEVTLPQVTAPSIEAGDSGSPSSTTR